MWTAGLSRGTTGATYSDVVIPVLYTLLPRAKLLAAEAKLAGDPCLLWYGATREPRPAWLGVVRLLGEPGLQEDSALSREVFLARMEARRWAEEQAESLASPSAWWGLG